MFTFSFVIVPLMVTCCLDTLRKCKTCGRKPLSVSVLFINTFPSNSPTLLNFAHLGIVIVQKQELKLWNNMSNKGNDCVLRLLRFLSVDKQLYKTNVIPQNVSYFKLSRWNVIFVMTCNLVLSYSCSIYLFLVDILHEHYPYMLFWGLYATIVFIQWWNVFTQVFQVLVLT